MNTQLKIWPSHDKQYIPLLRFGYWSLISDSWLNDLKTVARINQIWWIRLDGVINTRSYNVNNKFKVWCSNTTNQPSRPQNFAPCAVGDLCLTSKCFLNTNRESSLPYTKILKSSKHLLQNAYTIRRIAITNCPFRFAFSHLPRFGQLLRQKDRKNFTWNLCARFS